MKMTDFPDFSIPRFLDSPVSAASIRGKKLDYLLIMDL